MKWNWRQISHSRRNQNFKLLVRLAGCSCTPSEFGIESCLIHSYNDCIQATGEETKESCSFWLVIHPFVSQIIRFVYTCCNRHRPQNGFDSANLSLSLGQFQNQSSRKLLQRRVSNTTSVCLNHNRCICTKLHVIHPTHFWIQKIHGMPDPCYNTYLAHYNSLPGDP